ncbi:MAG: hypothetical protein P0Y49_12450 [Candidatus Pedobacter colombiensis]|uniref:DUF4412 domain-containing protein n=1 Tax=Candidatus Pedobacter colombiensis TaxID=3121371 RepID=A0AAJ5W5P0_9SPHI|nr:hypothetical protein [Pedobacter sp.]WEK17605.1 MAG: hypothetical protein P0Y49_12450 [Pedobacter sp.]
MFKSIKTGVLVIILIGTAIVAKAQKVIDAGTITYGVEYVLTDDQKKQVDPSVLPSESKVEFNGNISKVQMDLGMAMLKVLTDGAASNALVLVDIPMMQKQYAAKMSKEEIEKQRGSLKYSDFKATGEKQNIAGFNAEKYTYKDNNGADYELWATTELKLPLGANPPGFADLNGTPIKFTNTQDGFKTLLTLKSVKEGKIGPFSLDVPKGYEIKTMDELKAMRGGR